MDRLSGYRQTFGKKPTDIEPSGKRVILHVDLNSFFATAEQQANPSLRGKPVGIIKAGGRTCVIAASTQAKKYGVKTGSSTYEAKKLCPGIILVPADFEKYADITYRFIDICSRYSPSCEVFSLDECFIDVTETEKFFGNVFKIAFDLKDTIRTEIGNYITCSVGISHNRLLAKLASGQIKPDGLFWITEDNVIEVLDRSELTDVCGLGWRLYSRLSSLSIENFPKLRKCSLSFLKKHFGPFWSVHLYNLSRGIDYSPVTPFSALPDAKSVGRTYTAHRNLYKRSEVRKLMRNLCEETTAKVRQMRLCGRYVGLCLRGGENSRYGHLTLKTYIDDGKVLFDLCDKISQDWAFFKKGTPVRYCGITLSMLIRKDVLSAPLFPQEAKRQSLVKAIDRINENFGDYTVFPATLSGIPIIRPEVNGYFGDKKYRLDFLNK